MFLKPFSVNDDKTVVLAVRNRNDLLMKVVPFFERYPLHTAKRRDFQIFSETVRAMTRGEHLSPRGFRKIVKTAFTMNAHGSQRKYAPEEILQALESSETIRLGRHNGDKT